MQTKENPLEWLLKLLHSLLRTHCPVPLVEMDLLLLFLSSESVEPLLLQDLFLSLESVEPLLQESLESLLMGSLSLESVESLLHLLESLAVVLSLTDHLPMRACRSLELAL